MDINSRQNHSVIFEKVQENMVNWAKDAKNGESLVLQKIRENDIKLKEIFNGEIQNINIDSSKNSDIGNVDIGNKFLPDNLKIDEFLTENILTPILDSFKYLFKPIIVDYSNEILSQQIHNIAILLFILGLIIFLLLILTFINTLIIINKDRFLNYFKNKYLLAYINFQLNIYKIELFFLFGIIFYFLYYLLTGILFIITHPVIF